MPAAGLDDKDGTGNMEGTSSDCDGICTTTDANALLDAVSVAGGVARDDTVCVAVSNTDCEAKAVTETAGDAEIEAELVGVTVGDGVGSA